MVEKGATGGGQFDAVHAAAHQLNANLVFEISDLATEGRLRRVQPFLSRAMYSSSISRALCSDGMRCIKPLAPSRNETNSLRV